MFGLQGIKRVPSCARQRVDAGRGVGGKPPQRATIRLGKRKDREKEKDSVKLKEFFGRDPGSWVAKGRGALAVAVMVAVVVRNVRSRAVAYSVFSCYVCSR